MSSLQDLQAASLGDREFVSQIVAHPETSLLVAAQRFC